MNIMKRYILKGISLLSIVVVLSGCQKDYLDVEATKTATIDQIEDLAQTDPGRVLNSYLDGIHNTTFDSRESHDDFGLNAFNIATDLMTGDMAYKSGVWFFYDYYQDNRYAPYRRTRGIWGTYYEMIRSANQILEIALPEGSDIEDLDEEAQSIVGQAYAIRGYSYFKLVNHYQRPYQIAKDKLSIPVHTDKGVSLAPKTVAEVYELIESDLETAYHLLEGAGVSKPERMNEYAVALTMANVKAFKGEWDEVIKYTNYVIDGKGSDIIQGDDLLSGLYEVDLSGVLWGARITPETGTFYASFFSHMDAYSFGYGGDLGQYKRPASVIMDGIGDDDIRKNWFKYKILAYEDEAQTIPSDSVEVQVKFVDKTGEFTADYIYMRVAEAYYLKAEAQLEKGDEASALTTLETVMTTRDPEYSATAKGRSLQEELYFQKRVEFWGEGKRILDVVRRGETVRYNESDNHDPNIASTLLEPYDIRLFHEIPQGEIDANPELNDQVLD